MTVKSAVAESREMLVPLLPQPPSLERGKHKKKQFPVHRPPDWLACMPKALPLRVESCKHPYSPTHPVHENLTTEAQNKKNSRTLATLPACMHTSSAAAENRMLLAPLSSSHLIPEKRTAEA